MTKIFKKEHSHVLDHLEWMAVDKMEHGIPSQFESDKVPALYFKGKDSEVYQRWKFKPKFANIKLMTVFVNRITNDTLGLPDYAWIQKE